MHRLHSRRLCNLCSEFLGGFAGFGPVGGEDLGELARGHGREEGEDVLEVGVGIDASAAAAFDDGVEDGSTLPGSGFAHKQPVALTDGSRRKCIVASIDFAEFSGLPREYKRFEFVVSESGTGPVRLIL